MVRISHKNDKFSDQQLRTEKKKVDVTVDVMPSTSADALAVSTQEAKRPRLDVDEVFSRSL